MISRTENAWHLMAFPLSFLTYFSQIDKSSTRELSSVNFDIDITNVPFYISFFKISLFNLNWSSLFLNVSISFDKNEAFQFENVVL